MDFLCFFINNILLNIKIKILNEKETRRIIIQGIITYLEPYTLYIEHKFDIKSLSFLTKSFFLNCNPNWNTGSTPNDLYIKALIAGQGRNKRGGADFIPPQGMI